MWVKQLLTVAISTIVLNPIPGISAEAKHDVQELYRMCKKPLETGAPAICGGYIAGVSAFMAMIGAFTKQMRTDGGLANDNDRKVLSHLSKCGDATVGAMIQAFTNWAEKHPEKWSQNQLFGVIDALNETWPCN